MIDTRALRQRHDCRVVVERYLGRPRHHGRAWLWRCPFHHEQQGHSLAVWADGWRCYGACDAGGDVIEFVRRYEDLAFAEACRRLDGAPPAISPIPARPAPACGKPPAADWQRQVARVVREAAQTLWQQPAVLDYLVDERGLCPTTIRRHLLGYVPGGHRQWVSHGRLRIPCGITIPWLAGGHLWALKVRRLGGPVRYQQVAGGSSHGLYGADDLQPGRPGLLVEGEFDRLLAWRVLGSQVTPVTSGGSGSRLDARWLSRLRVCPLVYICLDSDEAGRRAALQRAAEIGTAARILTLPAKDITAWWQEQGPADEALRRWWAASIRDRL